MTDQGWATLIGLAVVVVLRLVDYMFPRGYAWKRTMKNSVKIHKDDDEE